MTILIIVLIYLGTVFLARWLNYKAIVSEGGYGPIWAITWIIPPINIIIICAFICVIISNIKFNIDSQIINWFTGKHWKTK